MATGDGNKAGYSAVMQAAGGPLGENLAGDEVPGDEVQPDMFGKKRAGPGRPKGSLNKRTTALVDDLVAAGHKRPLQWLFERFNDEDAPMKDRLAAAIAALPYAEQKMPVAVDANGAQTVVIIGNPAEDYDPAELAQIGAYTGEGDDDPAGLVTIDVQPMEVADDD